ncbi:MAG: hypothetical protein AAGF57_01455 [Pseudomonadota bacterium]
MLRSFRGWYAKRSQAVCASLLASTVTFAQGEAGLTTEQTDALEDRVQQRWQAMIAKDFGSVWEFSTPTFRGIFSKSMYVHKFSYAVDWELTEIEIVNYDADAAVASVAVGVMSKPVKHTSAASKALGAVPVTMNEKWIFTDGEWWHSTND